VPLYFMYGGAPPAWNVLTRDLIRLLTCAGMVIFIAGISHLVVLLRPAAGFASLIAAGSGFILIAITLVTTSLEAGVVFGAPDGRWPAACLAPHGCVPHRPHQPGVRTLAQFWN
jgi:hypothetical protein